MDWAMHTFQRKGIHAIEGKVIEENPARTLCEIYGFQIDAVMLRKEMGMD